MDIELCPPYWPRLLWPPHWHGPIPDPPPIDRELFERLDAHFASLAVAVLANRLGDKRVGHEIGKLVGPLMSQQIAGLTHL